MHVAGRMPDLPYQGVPLAAVGRLGQLFLTAGLLDCDLIFKDVRFGPLTLLHGGLATRPVWLGFRSGRITGTELHNLIK